MTPDHRPLRMELGGLGFLVRCATAPVAADLDDPYLPFVFRAEDAVPAPAGGARPSGDDVRPREGAARPPAGDVRPPADDVVVDVRLEPAPSSAGTLPLFQTGHAWTMRARDRERFLFHQGPAREAPLWTAGFPVEAESAVVWCDPAEWGPRADDGAVSSPLRYPLDQILLMYALAARGGILVHATGVVVEGRAVACCGVSGAGKSTLARLLAETGAGGLLSDDRVILRRGSLRPLGERGHRPAAEGGSPAASLLAYGTPWPGDARVAVNGSAPLGALLFLRHGPENRVTPLSASGALHRLLPVASVPWFDAEVLSSALGVCEDVVGAVPAFELEFRPEPAAADLVRGLLRVGAGSAS